MTHPSLPASPSPSRAGRLGRACRPVIESLEGRRLLSSTVFSEGFDAADERSNEGIPWVGVLEGFSQPDGATFGVNDGRFVANNTDVTGAWGTGLIALNGTGRLTLDVTGIGSLNPYDFLRVRVVAGIDGSLSQLPDGPTLAETTINGSVPGGRTTLTLDDFSGGDVRILVTARNSSPNETYTFDNVRLERTGGLPTGLTFEKVDGTLFVTGTPGDDDVRLGTDGVDTGLLGGLPSSIVRVTDGDGNATTFFRVNRVEVDLGAGDDAFTTVGELALNTTDFSSSATFRGGAIVVRGGDGADTLTAEVDSFGDDLNSARTRATLVGGAGDDMLTLSSDDLNTLLAQGGDGNDIINVDGTAVAEGGDGADTITGGGFPEFIRDALATLRGGAGDDTIVAQAYSTASGGAGDDVIDVLGAGGTLAAPSYAGDAGDDTVIIRGGGGYRVSGGDGTDTLDLRPLDDPDLVVTLDDVANDDPVDRDDDRPSNFASDIERVLGVGDRARTLYATSFNDEFGARRGQLVGGGTYQVFDPDADNGTAQVQDGRFRISSNNNLVSLYTSPLEIAGRGPVEARLTLADAGASRSNRANVVFRVDGRVVENRTFNGGLPGGSTTVTSGPLAGRTLQIEVQVDAPFGGYTVDDLRVTAAGPAAPAVTATLADGTLTVTGTDGGDDVALRRGTGGLELLVGGAMTDTFAFDEVSRAVFDLLGGDDRLRVTGFGNAVLNGGDGADTLTGVGFANTYDGGAGDDTIEILRGDDGGNTVDRRRRDGHADLPRYQRPEAPSRSTA